MKASALECTDYSNGEFFKSLATILQSPVVNNTIILDSGIGTGSIRKIRIADGLTVAIWNVCLHHTLKVTRALTGPAQNRVISLSTAFSNAEILVERRSANLKKKINGPDHFLFDTASGGYTFTIPAHENVKAMIIHMEPLWLDRELKYCSPSSRVNIDSFITTSIGIIRSQKISVNDYQEYLQMFQQMLVSDDILFIKSSVLFILSQYFGNMFSNPASIHSDTNKLHFEKIQAVEKIIEEHLEDHLPSTQIISKKIGLSESSLKKYFRFFYHTGIYEYYLQKKMEMAFTMLTTQELSVKETAYRLGYEKPGSFIKIFKKYYHLSPGDVKRERA